MFNRETHPLFIFAGVLFWWSLLPASAQTNQALAPADSKRIQELNAYWKELSRTVSEGDYEGYSATYHPDAVCVFTTGQNKRTTPIGVQLPLWKKDFVDSKSGLTKNSVEFRFTQRVGDSTSAHETGIFYFTSVDPDGRILSSGAVHFESLLVKKNNTWLALMEFQKSRATQEEWEALKKL